MWVELAARNNAEWCDAVCDAHGLFGSFHDHVWACGERTPPLHPDAVTLDAAATATDVLAHVDTSTPGCSVKDSFSALDLAPAGFRVLFDATWIARASASADVLPDGWSPVTDVCALDRWRRAADRHISDAFLDRADVVVLAREASKECDEVVAGGVLHRSDDTVGIGNLFATDRDLDAAWSACLAFAAHRFDGPPVVGYEAGAPLAAALRHGFEEIGQLRVWVDDRTSQPRR